MFYFTYRRFGVSREIGINRGGRRRADVLALSLSGTLIICEVKSCLADFTSDKKLLEYLPACNQMYIVVPCQLVNKIKEQVKPHGIGVMTLGRNGYLYVASDAKKRPMMKDKKREMLLRIAWRGSEFNRRNTPRRQRIYLE